MGQLRNNNGTKMKAFVIATLVGMAAAAPAPHVTGHVHSHGHGAVVAHGPVLAHGPILGHPLAHAIHAAPLITHPVSHAVHASPLIAHRVPVIAHAAPAYPEVDEPYTYTYGVADDYSKANFNAAKTADGNGVVSGSYSVALPDGRTQTVKYTSDNYNGYVADVTYGGVPVYPEAPAYAPAPAYHA